MVLWYIFPRFGNFYKEKSGNPELHSNKIRFYVRCKKLVLLGQLNGFRFTVCNNKKMFPLFLFLLCTRVLFCVQVKTSRRKFHNFFKVTRRRRRVRDICLQEIARIAEEGFLKKAQIKRNCAT
jgi:hypothetical protein